MPSPGRSRVLSWLPQCHGSTPPELFTYLPPPWAGSPMRIRTQSHSLLGPCHLAPRWHEGMQKQMKGKAMARKSGQRCVQKSTDQELEDSDSQAVPPLCCVTMNKLPALSEPFLPLENEDNTDSVHFSELSPSKVCPVIRFTHYLFSRAL